MRIIRYASSSGYQWGFVTANGDCHDLSHRIKDDLRMDDFMEAISRLNFQNLRDYPKLPESINLGPCVSSVGKIIGVAINYRLHASETQSKEPSEPVLFLKANSSLSGPYDPIILPRGSSKTDWEVELGVVIGKPARYVTESQASTVIAGYCVLDDVSERSFQLERGGLQHSKGKSADSFCPIGPWLVTSDEISAPQDLSLWTRVNGVLMQNGSTKDMIFSVARLVSYISEFMSLQPGDIIATGTPDGVGKGRNPPLYLKAGDLIELGISGLGTQVHPVHAYEDT